MLYALTQGLSQSPRWLAMRRAVRLWWPSEQRGDIRNPGHAERATCSGVAVPSAACSAPQRHSPRLLGLLNAIHALEDFHHSKELTVATPVQPEATQRWACRARIARLVSTTRRRLSLLVCSACRVRTLRVAQWLACRAACEMCNSELRTPRRSSEILRRVASTAPMACCGAR